MAPNEGRTPPAPARRFTDRRAAGRALAVSLSTYRGLAGLLVLGLARGGVPVGWEVAAALGAPLDVFVVRKLGVPSSPELAMGALAGSGRVVLNDSVIAELGITPATISAAVRRESAELTRRELAYRGGRSAIEVRGRPVILVDDGIATGASMRVALRALRADGATPLVAAVPVGPASAGRELAAEADRVVCTTIPAHFTAVGQAYADFDQVDDAEVIRLLATPTGATG